MPMFLVIPPDRFETRQLILRRPRLSDADDMFDHYAADPEVTRYVTWRPYRDRSEGRPFLRGSPDGIPVKSSRGPLRGQLKI